MRVPKTNRFYRLNEGLGDNIENKFHKKEYRQLLDLVYIANWVMNARNIEKDTKTVKYDELVQKVYSFAGEFKLSDLIEFNKQLEGYYPTNKYEMDGDVHQFIDEYD